MIAPAEAVAAIPDGLQADEVAPLLCAGITTFNALRHSGATPGQLVAVQGIGGLGHLGIQCARQMGFRTVAIGRGADKKPLAVKFGAHEYVDTDAGSPADACKNGWSQRDSRNRARFQINFCTGGWTWAQRKTAL